MASAQLVQADGIGLQKDGVVGGNGILPLPVVRFQNGEKLVDAPGVPGNDIVVEDVVLMLRQLAALSFLKGLRTAGGGGFVTQLVLAVGQEAVNVGALLVNITCRRGGIFLLYAVYHLFALLGERHGTGIIFIVDGHPRHAAKIIGEHGKGFYVRASAEHFQATVQVFGSAAPLYLFHGLSGVKIELRFFAVPTVFVGNPGPVKGIMDGVIIRLGVPLVDVYQQMVGLYPLQAVGHRILVVQYRQAIFLCLGKVFL